MGVRSEAGFLETVLGRPGSDRLSHVLRHSTIGAGGFNGRVRNGIGWNSPAMTTRPAKNDGSGFVISRFIDHVMPQRVFLQAWNVKYQAFKPIERLGLVSSTHYCAYTSSLSTWSSSTALKRDLVLRRVSRLDAFSGYLFNT